MSEEEKSELDFLQYFHGAVEDFLGPASDDVYENIKQQWAEDTGLPVPEGY